jgi:hypothetical protein
MTVTKSRRALPPTWRPPAIVSFELSVVYGSGAPAKRPPAGADRLASLA